MTEVRQGPTPHVRFREVSALTRRPLRRSRLYICLICCVIYVSFHRKAGIFLTQFQ